MATLKFDCRELTILMKHMTRSPASFYSHLFFFSWDCKLRDLWWFRSWTHSVAGGFGLSTPSDNIIITWENDWLNSNSAERQWQLALHTVLQRLNISGIRPDRLLLTLGQRVSQQYDCVIVYTVHWYSLLQATATLEERLLCRTLSREREPLNRWTKHS